MPFSVNHSTETCFYICKDRSVYFHMVDLRCSFPVFEATGFLGNFGKVPPYGLVVLSVHAASN